MGEGGRVKKGEREGGREGGREGEKEGGKRGRKGGREGSGRGRKGRVKDIEGRKGKWREKGRE